MRTLLYLLFLLNAWATHAQPFKLNKVHKDAAARFWKLFGTAVQNNDQDGIMRLCGFPVVCDFCEGIDEDHPNITITKQSFISLHHKLFFSEYLKEMVAASPGLPALIRNNERMLTEYSFTYPLVKPSVRGEGKQVFVTIRLIKNQFKIISVWSVP